MQKHIYGARICAIACLPVHPEHHDAAMTYLGVAGHPKIVPAYLATWLSNLFSGSSTLFPLNQSH
jgi:hypothetical protein